MGSVDCTFPLLPARVRHYYYMNWIVNGMEALAWGGHYLASPDVASPWLSSPLLALCSLLNRYGDAALSMILCGAVWPISFRMKTCCRSYRRP